jgi:hypothetical protein
MRIVCATLAAVSVGVVLTGCGAEAVEVAVPKPDAATTKLCERLRIPDKVDGQKRRSVTPKSALTAAWGSPPIGFRCGVPLPEHDPLEQTVSIDGVIWLPTPANRPVTYTAVGRQAYVEVTIPPTYVNQGRIAGEILMDFNPAIKKAIPAKSGGQI